MTIQEFSDAFDTMLASYNHKADFGDLSSYADVTLDEYEKSVFLTLALDNIVKSYFERTTNSQGAGFDDSARRQVDFSSLIKVAKLEKITGQEDNLFDERGILYQLPRKVVNNLEVDGTTDVLFILNEKLVKEPASTSDYWYDTIGEREAFEGPYEEDVLAALDTSLNWLRSHGSDPYSTIEEAEADGWKWVNVHNIETKEYVIVPINYKEYDREMSRPYAQPLKKQAWRLFLNLTSKFDVKTELIPKFNVKEEEGSKFIYKIRYVKRPNPIILEDLPNNLTIDGQDKHNDCELNPIIHIDILEEAVRLALNSKGIETRDLKAAREAARNNRG